MSMEDKKGTSHHFSATQLKTRDWTKFALSSILFCDEHMFALVISVLTWFFSGLLGMFYLRRWIRLWNIVISSIFLIRLLMHPFLSLSQPFLIKWNIMSRIPSYICQLWNIVICNISLIRLFILDGINPSLLCQNVYIVHVLWWLLCLFWSHGMPDTAWEWACSPNSFQKWKHCRLLSNTIFRTIRKQIYIKKTTKPLFRGTQNRTQCVWCKL